jgi:Carboxypeptidase regulatory-like domain/TonB dependent receptor
MLGKQLLACLLLVLAARLGIAQSTFGTIVGVVRDQSGASVPEVKVDAQNLDDGIRRSAVSAADGSFQFLNLKPGRYGIEAGKAEFATFKIAALDLNARQTVRADIVLQVAAVGQSVEVVAAAGSINTENGTLGDTKNFQQVVGLPVNYRGATTSPLAALATVPGVQEDAQGNVSLSGGTPSQIQYSVDGASTVNIRQNGALGNMNPSSELISEFKVTQFNNNAEFSQAGDVTITTKSGGGQIHGSMFEYLQNSLLDATPYGFDSKAHKAFNTFGGSVSGPVELPHLYNGHDRTFFFADYEGNRRSFSTPQQFSVPTQAMRQGDLSGLAGTAIIDPFSGAAFPGNRIPIERLNPVSQALLTSYIPLPNFGNGTDTNANYRRLTPTPGDTNGYDVRVDHNLSSSQQIYGRWSWKNVDSTVPNAILPSDSDHETNRNFLFSYNYTIKPNLLNEARFGTTYYTLNVNFPIKGADAISQLGLLGLDLSDHPDTNAFPTFNYSDGTGFTPLGRDKSGVTKSQTIQFADNLTWVKGKHTLKFGVDVRRVYYQDLESFGGSDDFGSFTFSSGAFTGNALGNLLVGLPSTTYVAQSGPDVHSRAIQTGLYAQDDWRVNNRLTLSFGLRWQALPPFVSEDNNLTAFDPRNGGIIVPDNNQPRQGFLVSINACPGINPALPCGPVEKASQVGLGSGVREFYKGNYQPRFSFAYRPFNNNKTVVRGGFGIFTITSLGQLSFNTTNIDVAVVRTTANSLLSNGQPAYQFPLARPADNALATAGTGDFYQNVDRNYRDPQSAQWNFTVERELAANLALKVSYLGMNTYRLPVTVDLNQVQSSTQPYNAGLRPYQNWGRILSSENLGFANYQGLQTELDKRFSHGLLFQASYALSKNLGDAGGDAPGAFSPEVIYGTPVADRFNLRLDRGNIAGTRQQRGLISAIYQLPVGKDRAFLRTMNRAGEALLGGWEISTVSMLESGPFLTPITSPSLDPANLNLVYRGAILRPDQIGNGNLTNPTPDQYFNINAFVPTPANAGRIGNAGVGTLVGPGTIAVAGGLAKTFQVHEGVRMRFEATFTNLANHPNFAAPSVDVSSPATFGKITSVQSAENSGNRTGQAALRIDF